MAERLLWHQPETLKIPAIVKAELIVGALKSRKLYENMRQVQEFLGSFEIIPFDDAGTLAYGQIRTSLEKSGQSIGPNDLIIAATVFSRSGVLVTHNTGEFQRVMGLPIEDWTE